jgi:hypothetical protein
MLEGIGSGEQMLTATFIAYETAFAFSQYLPSVMTIKSFVDSQEKVAAIREGECIAAAFSIGFAVVFSVLLKSPLPLLLAAAAIVFTVYVYERALRASPAFTGKPIDGAQEMAYSDSDTDEYGNE